MAARRQARHEDTCLVCQGVAALKPEPVMPGRPRDSKASLGSQPLRFKEKTK